MFFRFWLPYSYKYLDLTRLINEFQYIVGKNPPALCIPIPQLPILAMCIKLTDIHTDDQFLYACLSMELQFTGVPLVVFNFDCAQLGQNGITFLKPTAKPPSENGQWDLNLSLANLEEALRNRTTNAAPGGWPNLFEFNLKPTLSNDTIIKIVEAVNNIVKNDTSNLA